jgi:hypothetical protein
MKKIGITIFASFLMFGAVLLAADTSKPTTNPATQALKQIDARLGGTLDNLIGIPFQREAHNTHDFHIGGPVSVTVTLPDGRSFTSQAKLATVSVREGTIVEVKLLPLMEAVPYDQAVDALKRQLEAFGIKPDERMQTKMAEWPRGLTGPTSGRRIAAGMVLGDTFELETEVRGTGGYYFAISFFLSVNEQLRLRGLTPLPPPRQPASPTEIGNG